MISSGWAVARSTMSSRIGLPVTRPRDASCAEGALRLGGSLLAWLERQPFGMDVAHRATLLDIAHDFEAFTNASDAPQALL